MASDKEDKPLVKITHPILLRLPFDFDLSIFQRGQMVVFREAGKVKEDEDSNIPVALISTLLSTCLKLLTVKQV